VEERSTTEDRPRRRGEQSKRKTSGNILKRQLALLVLLDIPRVITEEKQELSEVKVMLELFRKS